MDDRIEAVALLPCPFCGGVPRVTTWEVGGFGEEEAGVICHKCGATHAEAVGYSPSADEVAAAHRRAVAAWNRRAQGSEK